MIKIVTDATIRFPTSSFINHQLIKILPLSVTCNGESVADGPQSGLSGMRQLMDGCPQGTDIKVPSVDEIADLYRSLQTNSNQIVSIHSSGALSRVYDNAVLASTQFRGRMDIQVIDSQTVSLGLGLIVQAAGQAIERGENLDAVIRLVRGMIPRLYTVFFLEDLFFLERSNLIHRSQAILGNMLGVIPFLTMEEGHLIPMEKVRSRVRALEKLIEFVCEFSEVDHLGILMNQTHPTEESQGVADRLRAIYPSTPIASVCYGPLLSTHLGFHALGAVVLESKEDAF
jgi:DegV family protein with EDD domain